VRSSAAQRNVRWREGGGGNAQTLPFTPALRRIVETSTSSAGITDTV
jgi:hypothetical protein